MILCVLGGLTTLAFSEAVLFNRGERRDNCLIFRGFRLRTHISDLEEMVVGLGLLRPGSYDLVDHWEARFSFDDGSVQLGVDIRNGKIFKLIACGNYKGMFDGKIHVGMAVSKAFAADSRLYYDEPKELILCRGIEGIVFDVPVVDPFPAEVPSLTISAISVYAVEINTSDGVKGRW